MTSMISPDRYFYQMTWPRVQPGNARATENLFYETWDEIVRQDREIEFLHQTQLHQNEFCERLSLAIIDNPERRSALFNKLALEMNHHALEWVWNRCTKERLEMIWELEIVPRRLEIPLLFYYRFDWDLDLLFENQQRRMLLLERYKDDFDALSVIWKTLPNDEKEAIWNLHIFPTNHEIQFLSQICGPRDDPFDHFPGLNTRKMRKQRRALIERHATNALALAVICKVFDQRMQRQLWDKVIVPHDLELAFLSHLDQPGAALSGNVVWLLETKKHRFGASRAIELLAKYPHSKEEVFDFLNRGQSSRRIMTYGFHELEREEELIKMNPLKPPTE